MPAAMADRAPRIVEFENGQQAWEYERNLYPNIGLNAVVGTAPRGLEHGPGPVLRDAAGLLRHPRPGRRHGPERSLGVALLPVARRRILRVGLLPLERPRARARMRARLERLARRRLGRDLPGAHHPAAASLACRRRPRRSRGAPERCARLSGRSASPSSRRVSAFPRSSRGRGTRSSPACAETETVVCLHIGASAWAPLPSPDPPFELFPTLFPGERDTRGRRVAVVGSRAAHPRPVGRNVRRRDRLGADAHGPRRLRARPFGVGHRERDVAVGPAPERGSRAQLLLLLDRRPLRGRAPRADRRRPHHGRERLPARRLDLAGHPGACSLRRSGTFPTTSCARSPPGTPHGCSATLSPTATTGGSQREPEGAEDEPPQRRGRRRARRRAAPRPGPRCRKSTGR